uniref:NADH-ubiquinone oxidoreductase chain 2 n=1 Tax=Nematobrycon palmeri TaxID=272066 RepID=A0A7G7YL58_9TELE|nr:NADH dehydrogenase subunit 2 [Nematobrycon palmeri]QNH95228.1 NADH dehydrogenase subunit 2 [Nematobrycon palmeri]
MPQILLYIFLASIGLGTTLTFLSTHWLFAWVGLEISTAAIMPLMTQHHHPRASEAATKYLLIQASATGMLMFATAFNGWMEVQWEIMNIKNEFAIALVMLALSMKLGLAPFHLWLPEVMQGINLMTGLILSTWQKLAPFALLLQMSHAIHFSFLTTVGILSAALATWGGLNQTQLRKILAYSSTAHLGWIIIVIQFAPNLSMLALGIYIFMTMAAFLTLMETSSTKISTFSISWSKNPIMAATMVLVLLSLAGLPPLTGFMNKWCIIDEMTKQEMAVPSTMIMMTALISLYFYIRLCYFSAITLFPNTSKTKISWRRKNKKDKNVLSTVLTVAIIVLPVTPLVMAFTYFYLI